MSVYDSMVELVKQYIYGGSFPVGGEAIGHLVATAGSLFLIGLPFIIVIKIMKLILR